MKILLVNKYHFVKGGSERSYFALSDELAARGHEVMHFSMKHPKNLPSPFAEYFVPEKDYHGAYSLGLKSSLGLEFIRSRTAASNIERLVRAHKPDIAHLHNIYHQLTPSIIPVLTQNGIPVVMTLHDYKLVCPSYKLFAGGKYCYRCKGGRFYGAVSKRCCDGSFLKSSLLAAEAYWQKWSGAYKRISYFIAPSRYIRDRFIESGFEEDKIIYMRSSIPNAVSSVNEESAGRVLEALPQNYILYFGRLSAEKGLFTLLEAAGFLGRIPVVLCGEGPIAAELKNYAEKNLRGLAHFPGYMERGPLHAVIRNATAVVVPSLWPENAPFAVLESAAAGVPVIVSDRGGLPEMAEMLSGEVFAHDSPKELAERIAGILDDPEKAKLSGSDARKGLAKYYGRKEHMAEVEKIYLRAVENGPA